MNVYLCSLVIKVYVKDKEMGNGEHIVRLRTLPWPSRTSACSVMLALDEVCTSEQGL